MLERKTFCVITGASRGLGRAIAEEIAPKLGAGSVLAVMARTQAALEELKQQLGTSYSKITIHVAVVDLGTGDQEWFATIFQKVIQETGSDVRDFEQALLINNAGSLGDVSKSARDLLEKDSLNYYISVNFISMVMLTTHFLKLFSRQNTPHQCIVNISSRAAVVPYLAISMYCACKASRLMFYRALAAEEPDVKVLSYDPGFVDTDMQLDLRMNLCQPEKSIELYEDGNLVTPTLSASNLMSILEEGNYQSGDHVVFDHLK